jgi:hypothetical protein
MRLWGLKTRIMDALNQMCNNLHKTVLIALYHFKKDAVVLSDSKRPGKGGDDVKAKGAMFAPDRAAKLINSFISMGDIFGQTASPPPPPADAADPSASIALPLAETDEEAGARQLKRVTTSAKAATAVLVDGPFAELDFYMKKPVSQYMTLDDKLITRLGESTFRLAVPLSTIVGLELTPTIDVVVNGMLLSAAAGCTACQIMLPLLARMQSAVLPELTHTYCIALHCMLH